MNFKKLFLLPVMILFLAVLVQAAVTTTVLYRETTENSTEIINGDTVHAIVGADSLFESSMRITVVLMDSSGVLRTLLDTQTTADSYSNVLSINPSIYGGIGNYTIVSTVRGASGDSDIDYLSLSVRAPINNPPVIISTPSDTQLNEGDIFAYQVSATDADGDAITYSLVQAPSWITMGSNGFMTGVSPNLDEDYTFGITVEASDGEDFDRQTFSIFVRDLNTPDTTAPFITIVSPQNNQLLTTNNVLFDITTNEPVSSAQVVFCALGGVTEDCSIWLNTFNLNEISSTHFSRIINLTNGNYKILFTATDLAGNLGTTNTLSFTVNTSGNNAPLITSNPVTTINEDQAYSYQVTATDSDGDALTYMMVANAPWLSMSSGLITGTAPSVSANTDYTITITVSDGTEVTTQTYTLTVINTGTGGSTGRGRPGGATTGFASDISWEEQQYLDQFKPIITATDEDADGLPGKSKFSVGSLLFILFGLLILALLVVLAIFLVKKLSE